MLIGNEYWRLPKSKILIRGGWLLDQKTGTYSFLIVLSAQAA
jgi:hypothetical protein